MKPKPEGFNFNFTSGAKIQVVNASSSKETSGTYKSGISLEPGLQKERKVHVSPKLPAAALPRKDGSPVHSVPKSTAPKLALASTESPAASKLFMVKNGEMKPIKQSNISSSGILFPVVDKQRAPALRPIRPKFIVNNSIPGGVMTMEQYQQKVEHQKKDKLERRAVAPKPVTIYNVIRPGDLDLDSTVEFAHVVKNKPGRRPGFVYKPPKEDDNELAGRAPGSLTRSGRLSRPPRHYQRFYAKDQETGGGERQPESDDAESPEPPPLPKRRRGPTDRFKCEKCGKSYWTDRNLQCHISMVHEGAANDDSLHIDCFNYFLGKLKKVPMNLRGKIFLDEIEIFVEKVQRLMQKLIRKFEETRMKDGFLNYSQVHQIPKVMEAVLNVEAGQYHFNTEIIDADEKTILGEHEPGGPAISSAGGAYQPKQQQQQRGEMASHSDHEILKGIGLGESTLSGFDDSSTQPPISNGDPSAKEHIMSLNDTIFDSAISSSHPPDDFYDDDFPDEDDDLTTPKKDPFPSPATKRMRTLKRALKNLNHGESFAPPNVPHLLEAGSSPSIIQDLSLELFQSSSRTAGTGTLRPNNDLT